MKRISLFLVLGLVATGALAGDPSDPIQAALDQPSQDPFFPSFAQDLNPPPLQNQATQGYKIDALDEVLSDRAESSGVVEGITNIAGGAIEGAVNLVIKTPTKVLGGIKSVFGHLPGIGSDTKTEKIEAVDTLGVPSLELKVGDEIGHTFFEREFAKQLANHRTVKDFGNPSEGELRGERVLKFILLQRDFRSDK